MTEAEFQRVVWLSGIKANKVRAYLSGRLVNAGNRSKIIAALAALGIPPSAPGECAFAKRRTA